MKNAEVLEAIADPDFVTELGQFNLEINVAAAAALRRRRHGVRERRPRQPQRRRGEGPQVGAHMVMVGILPTLRPQHMHPDTLSANPRYRLLNDQIFAARGEDLEIAIRGVDRLRVTADSIMPEAACTSMQLHLQVSPDDFPTYWNASQAIAGIQLALGANSPVPVRQGALGRDPDRAVRAGHRHPQRGAEVAGCPATGVVRRALDHLDLRPVRGERPLLPGPAPHHR